MPTATTTEFPRVIKRNAREVRDVIIAKATHVRSYTLGNNFSGDEVKLDWFKANILTEIETHRPKLRQDKPGTYTVQYHSNHWLEVSVA